MAEAPNQIKKRIAALETFERRYGEYLDAIDADAAADPQFGSGGPGSGWSDDEYAKRKRELSELALPADKAIKASGAGQYVLTHPPAIGGGVKAADLPSQIFEFGDVGYGGNPVEFQRAILDRIPAQLSGLKMKLEEAEEERPRQSLLQHMLARPRAKEKSADDVPTPALREPSHHRVEVEGLPSQVQELVEELNDSLGRGNRNAAALLTRKILHTAVFIAMRRRGKGDLLKNAAGEDIDLAPALERCKQEYGVSAQMMSRVNSAKWISDTANHSYRLKVTQADLDQLVTAARLFLGEIFTDGEPDAGMV